MLKTLFITITTTLTVVPLATYLSFTSILGAFDLAAIPAATLAQLQASQKIVDTMKARHTRKHNRVTKRFVKRSGRRVASTVLAAATVGTVAVAAVMTSMEISDYRDQKRALREDANVLYCTDIEFDLEQCLEESADDAQAIIAEATDAVATEVLDAFDSTADYSSELWADIKAVAQNAIDYTDTAFTSLWISATSWFTE